MLRDARHALLQPFVLTLNFGDALLQFAVGGLNTLQGLTAAAKAPATLAQLRIHLNRRRFVPHFHLAAGVLKHHSQLRYQHAAELLHELGLRQAQRQGEAQVLHVVALNQCQLLTKLGQVGPWLQGQSKTKFGIQAAKCGIQHLPHFKAAFLSLLDQGIQTSAHRQERFFGAQVQDRTRHGGLHRLNFFSHAVTGQSDERVFHHPGMHHAQGLQTGGALLKIGGIGLHAFEHEIDLGGTFPTQSAQLLCLLGQLPTRVAQAAHDLCFHAVAGVTHRQLQHFAALG